MAFDPLQCIKASIQSVNPTEEERAEYRQASGRYKQDRARYDSPVSHSNCLLAHDLCNARQAVDHSPGLRVPALNLPLASFRSDLFAPASRRAGMPRYSQCHACLRVAFLPGFCLSPSSRIIALIPSSVVRVSLPSSASRIACTVSAFGWKKSIGSAFSVAMRVRTTRTTSETESPVALMMADAASLISSDTRA